MKKQPQADPNMQKLADLVGEATIAMLTTAEPDGTLRSRPLATLEMDSEGKLWFFIAMSSGKVGEIDQHRKVNLSYANIDKQDYVSISGHARLFRDPEKMRELWTPWVEPWFPEGLNDPDLGLLEVTVRAGEGSPWHVHPDEDEWFYVLEGEFTVYVGDSRLSLPAGSFAFGPRGVPHTFMAETDEARALIGFQPFLFEGFLREVGEPAAERVLPPPLQAPPDMARLLPIGARNGMEILGPPGPPPAH